MAKLAPALSPRIVEEFCELCNRAHEYWIHHLELFENNPLEKELMKSHAKDELMRLSVISHEYGLLQIAKLHDKTKVGGKFTLGVNYILVYGGWSTPVRDRLNKLKNKLDGFARQLRDARNKVLSHNDLSAIVSGGRFGAFAKGDDAKYFEALKEFANLVHEEVVGGPCFGLFDNSVKSDVAAFMNMIKPEKL